MCSVWFWPKAETATGKAQFVAIAGGQRLGITRAAISSYENNISLPSVNVLAELALLYRVSTDYLLGLDNRTAIVLEDLTPRQSAVIQEVMDTLVTEFKLSNRERSIKRQT